MVAGSSKLEQELLALIESSSPVKEEQIAAIFDKLPPVETETMIGSWRPGPYIETGHPGIQMLKDTKWNGKDFYSEDHVEPVMVLTEDGKRERSEQYGYAVLRRMEFRGVVSTAMIYDTQPIIDYFRQVDDDTVVGAMDTKMFPKEAGILYFALKRHKE